MHKILAVLFISILMAGCSGSRGCGCPSWGYNYNSDTDQPIVQFCPEEESEGFSLN